MAKRKKKKTETVQSKTNITVIVMGLFMILLSITGLYGSGIVGEWIKNISIFMFGSWNFLFLIFTLGLGLYMVFRSGRPAFFASRLVGIYSLIFALLIIAHSGMIRTNEIANGDIISTTYNMILESFKDATLVKGLGGGIIGALLTFASMSLFDVIGTYILAGIFIIIGIILVFALKFAVSFMSFAILSAISLNNLITSLLFFSDSLSSSCRDTALFSMYSVNSCLLKDIFLSPCTVFRYIRFALSLM